MNVYKNNEDFWRDPNDRRNVWDFSYYAITVFYYILSDYFSLIKIPEEETKYNLHPQLFNDDYKNISERILWNTSHCILIFKAIALILFGASD